MTNLIVFGAGASFGSDISGTPLLSNKLIDSLILFNPEGWGRLPSEFIESFREDFEQTMVHLSRQHPHSLPPLQRAMAAFFYQFHPEPNNLYRKLALKIRQSSWRGILVSLNYERLLELSLILEDISPICGRSCSNSTEIEICLPHGCCHIFCESVRASANTVSFMGPSVTTNGPISVISNPTDFSSRIQVDAFPPVMSYFEPQKRTTSGMNFIEAQRRHYRDLVMSSEKIALIGLKVRPHDRHIWDPLAETSAKLIYCAGDSSVEEFLTWSREHRLHLTSHIFPGNFNSEFNDLLREMDIAI
jgi:hypothetical protein